MRLAARNPWATPFSGWAFQRAWWDAYGANAHEETLVVVPADAPPAATRSRIVPLMHRHEVEPGDALTHTKMRHGAGRRADPGPADRHRASSSAPRTTPTTRRSWPRRPTCRPSPSRWPTTWPSRQRPAPLGRHRPAPAPLRRPDGRRARRRLRRARDGRGLDAQRRARGRLPGRDAAGRRERWTTTSPRSARRSATRSGARSAGPRRSGEVRLEDSTDPLADLETFIELHQKKWGVNGLFPDDAGRRPEPRPVPPPVRAPRRRTARCA